MGPYNAHRADARDGVPVDGILGYQTLGYFAATSRYAPADFPFNFRDRFPPGPAVRVFLNWTPRISRVDGPSWLGSNGKPLATSMPTPARDSTRWGHSGLHYTPQ